MKKAVFTIFTLVLLTSMMYGQNERGLREHDLSKQRLEKEDKYFEERGIFFLEKQNIKKINNGNGILFKPSLIYINDSTARQTYTYDNVGNILTEIYEEWQNGAWVNYGQYTYKYDIVGNILSVLHEGVPKYQITYTYDTDGNIITELEEIWQYDAWVNSMRYSYTYDENKNVLTEIDEYWGNGVWVNLYQYVNQYDESENRIIKISERWQNGIWVNNSLEAYTYDSSGNVLTCLIELWGNGTWENYIKYAFSYNINGNRVFSLFEKWQNGIWENYNQYSYTFDTNGNKLTSLHKKWQNGAWVNYRLYENMYDANNNTVSAYSYRWENNIWVNSDGDLNIIFNNNKGFAFAYGYYCTVEYTQFTDVKEELNNSLVFTLNQNYPNPFNPSTTIKFAIPQSEFVTIKVYDILGKEITTLINEELNAGSHTKIWDAKNLSSGVYFYKLQAGKFSETKKMILVR